MSAAVIDTTYRSLQGRKPVSPAVLYDFHNDAAGGMSVVDRFGNGPALDVNGTEGTIWTLDRGFVRFDGSTNQCRIHTADAAADYVADEIVPGMLTPGRGLLVACRFGWPTTKNTSNEVFVALGRNAADSAQVIFGTSNTVSLNLVARGLGASATQSQGFGAGSLYTTGQQVYSAAWYLDPKANGFDTYVFLDGVQVGTINEVLWTNDGGSVPPASTFALPDCLTIGAGRSNTSGSPTFPQRIGATNTDGTRLANVLLLAPNACTPSLAAEIALELHQYPRAIGELLAGV